MSRDHPTAVFTVPALADLPPEFLSGETSFQETNGVLSTNGI
ncbi:MAG: hypothetical protein OSB07_09560 [Dehalococcoidia bacterium]|nr:hypothetical protein [Dehalococcoidia bacterium]